jgi:hypothetical protein
MIPTPPVSCATAGAAASDAASVSQRQIVAFGTLINSDP